jgi:hypothetical protein
LNEKKRRQEQGKDFEFTVNSRPVILEEVERHGHRAGISEEALQHYHRFINLDSSQVRWQTPPPPPSALLLRSEQWRLPERFLFDVNTLVKGSFEAGLWSGIDQNQLIKSSNNQRYEAHLLHVFLNNLSCGSEAANANKYQAAGKFWMDAMKSIDKLIKCDYHDILPNLIQQINELNRQGRQDLARILKDHIAECCQTFLKGTNPTIAAYKSLGQLDMSYMVEIEERMMKQFQENFELYLGARNYNSFVMMMDYARRKLFRDQWVRIEDVLPPVDQLDRVFGTSDRRSLDVIALRLEVAKTRNQLELVEYEAPILIQRAQLILNDDWQRFYNLARGYFELGFAQYFLLRKALATSSLRKAQDSDDKLRELGDWNIFDPERVLAVKYLQDMQSWV